MVEPIDRTIRRLQATISEMEWRGEDPRSLRAQLQALLSDRERGERWHALF